MKKNKITTWLKNHKTELIIIGTVIVVSGGAILLSNNLDTPQNTLSLIKKNTPSQPTKIVPQIVKTMPTQPNRIAPEISSTPVTDNEFAFKKIDVTGFVRNLPQGQHPSPAKITEAEDLGIALSENQTVVSPHSRRCSM